MKFDICIDQLYGGKDFLQSMESTKQAGVDAYEFWKWWVKDVDAIVKKQDELGMRCVTFCTKFISLVDHTQRPDYIQGLCETIEVAKLFNVDRIISQVGNEIPELSRDVQVQYVVDGLKQCAPLLEGSGVTLLVEPLNHLDHPGYFLTRSDEAFRIIEAVNSQNIKILYDIYHFQIAEGDLIRTIGKHISQIGHFHCAGNPGRGEITKGEINYKEVFKAIKDLGYEGFIGLECRMSEDHENKIREAHEMFASVL